MPKRTSNSSVNSSIRQNTTATNEGFSQLLQLQKASNEYLQTIQSTLAQGLMMQRVSAIEELIIAKETGEEEQILGEIRDIMKDIAKSMKESVTASIINAGGSASSSNASTALIATGKEDKNEKKLADDQRDELLKNIEKNTRPKEVSKAKGGDDSGLGGFLGVFAAALGAVAGAMSGYIKSIKYFATLGARLVEAFAPDFLINKIRKTLASFLAGISMSYDLLKAAVTEKFASVIKFFDNVIEGVKAGFAFIKESKFGKLITNLISIIDSAAEPFVEAFKAISGFFGESKWFKSVAETFSKFAGTFKTFFTIAEKIFLPVTIIMTLWDTVKGAIEGFEKEGIAGGIAGAIKGFFNSLIFGPVDMIKDATAWVLGIFGFDEAKKKLESFNLEKMFSDFIDMLFSPVQTFNKIMAKFNDFLASFKGFTIPEFSFTIPFVNKKVSIGPFKPFGEADKQSNDTSGSASSTVGADNVKPLTSSSVAPAASTSTSNIVSSQSGAISSMKEGGGSSMTTVVAPSVNNNMQQTQVAKIEAPVRSNDSSLDRYFSARAVY